LTTSIAFTWYVMIGTAVTIGAALAWSAVFDRGAANG
jgi:hypothetical protein